VTNSTGGRASKTRTILLNSLWLLISYGLALAAGAASSYIISHYLGLIAFGQWALISSGAAFAGLAASGIGTAILRKSAEGELSLRPLGGAGVILQTLSAVTILSVSLTVVSFSLKGGDTTLPTLLMGAMAVIGTIGGVPTSIYFGQNRMQWQLINAFQGVGTVLLLLAFVRYPLGLLAPATAMLLSTSVVCVVTYIVFSRNVGGLPTLPSRRLLREVAALGIGLTFVALGQQIHWLVDSFLVNWLSDPIQLGILGAGIRLLPPLRSLAMAVTMAAFPVLIAQARADRQAFQRAFSNSLFLVVLLGTEMTIGLIGVSDQVISLLFPRSFHPAAEVLRVLGLTCIPLMIHWISLNGLVALGESYILILAYVLTILTQIAGAALLVPSHGALGMAVANVVSETVLAGVMYFSFVRHQQMPLDRRLIRTLLSAVFICAAAMIPGFKQRLVTAIAGMVMFPILLFFTGAIRTSDMRNALDRVRLALQS